MLRLYARTIVGDREPNGFDAAPEEVEAREAEPEAAGEEGASLAAALPEPVPVPATPEGGEDEGSEVEEAEGGEPADLPPHHTEAAGDAVAQAAGTVSETPWREEGAAEETGLLGFADRWAIVQGVVAHGLDGVENGDTAASEHVEIDT